MDLNGPRIRLLLAGQHLHERCFPSSVSTEQSDTLLRFDLKVDCVQKVGTAESDREILDGDERHRDWVSILGLLGGRFAIAGFAYEAILDFDLVDLGRQNEIVFAQSFDGMRPDFDDYVFVTDQVQIGMMSFGFSD